MIEAGEPRLEDFLGDGRRIGVLPTEEAVEAPKICEQRNVPPAGRAHERGEFVEPGAQGALEAGVHDDTSGSSSATVRRSSTATLQ